MAVAKTLHNETLAEPFVSFEDDKQFTVAKGWAPWWTPAAAGDPDWKMRQPIFSKYSLDGRAVQQLSTPFGTHAAGLWQQAPSAAGNRYEFSVEGQAWSSEDAAPGSMLEASDVNMQIGVDPTGGLDPDSPLILWSEKRQPLSHWETIHLAVEAESSIMTVFLKSAPKLPKRLQSIFWRNAQLRAVGRHKRAMNIIGAGDTHIVLEPEQPLPGKPVTATVSSNRQHRNVRLFIQRPDTDRAPAPLRSTVVDGERYIWRYEFLADMDGLYDIRFLGDDGARLLALRLLQVAREVQLVPSESARLDYERVYVLLPPTASLRWLEAAARGAFDGRYTIGFSADDAGIGELENRRVIAVNPHHWPEILTAAWFQQHYPGVNFTAVVANSAEDLEAWLRNWTGDS